MLAKVDKVVTSLGGKKSDIGSGQVWIANMADFHGRNVLIGAWPDRDAAVPPPRVAWPRPATV